MGVKSVPESSYVIGIKKGIMNQQLSLTIRGTFVKSILQYSKNYRTSTMLARIEIRIRTITTDFFFLTFRISNYYCILWCWYVPLVQCGINTVCYKMYALSYLSWLYSVSCFDSMSSLESMCSYFVTTSCIEKFCNSIKTGENISQKLTTSNILFMS
jgi:hypothetical protein